MAVNGGLFTFDELATEFARSSFAASAVISSVVSLSPSGRWEGIAGLGEHGFDVIKAKQSREELSFVRSSMEANLIIV